MMICIMTVLSGCGKMTGDKQAGVSDAAAALETDMSEERFAALAAACHGFEFIQAYREFEDHCLGGKDDTFWYIIRKDGREKDAYIGTLEEDGWKDIRIRGRGKRRKVTAMPSGSTIARIEKAAYLGQEEEWVRKRKPSLIEDSHPHRHYVYGFGDKALDVSVQYGISIGLSDLSDVPAGFHLRYLYVGDDVKAPD